MVEIIKKIERVVKKLFKPFIKESYVWLKTITNSFFRLIVTKKCIILARQSFKPTIFNSLKTLDNPFKALTPIFPILFPARFNSLS